MLFITKLIEQLRNIWNQLKQYAEIRRKAIKRYIWSTRLHILYRFLRKHIVATVKYEYDIWKSQFIDYFPSIWISEIEVGADIEPFWLYEDDNGLFIDPGDCLYLPFL